VFPDAKAVLASNSLDSPVIGLISRKNANLPLVSEMNKNWLDQEKASSANKARLEDPYAVWGSVLADSASLLRFSKHAVPNTDDFLQVSYKAPRVTYSPQEAPRDRLKQLVSDWQSLPTQDESELVQKKLKAYWHARKIYLEIGFSIKNGSNPLLVLTNYQDQLFQIIQESPEFRPADDTLNSLAAALQTSNPEIANKVIDKLQNIKKSAVQ
jgi:spermidine synthase